jgi:hypothetical protein
MDETFGCPRTVALNLFTHIKKQGYPQAGIIVLPIQNIDENNSARGRLIAQLRTGRLIGCTGAGVSIWAGYRSWPGVIDRLAAEVERRRNGEVNARLD